MFAAKNRCTSPASAESAHLVDQPLHRADVLRRQPRHRESHGHHLERLPHLVRLEELLRREGAHDRAPPRANRDEPLGGEAAESFADRRATDAERAGERHLLQLGAGRQPTRGDLLAEVLVDPLPERAVVEVARPVGDCGVAVLGICVGPRREL